MLKTIQFEGTLDCLEPVGNLVVAAAKEVGLSKERSYKLQLAVDEILTNIVLHGYGESGLTGNVRVSSEIEGGTLTLTLEDTAQEFNPRSLVPPSNLDAPLEERSIGGLGVFLALKSVDDFRYERSDGRNLNVFVMNAEGKT